MAADDGEQPDDSEEPEDLREIVEELRSTVRQNTHDIDYLGKQVREARQERDEAREENEVLHGRVDELEQRIESLVGLAEDQRSTPEKRAADLRQVMIRAAQAKDRAGVKWWKDEVEDHLAGIGHGELHKPQIYDAMEDAANMDGFDIVEKRVTKDGRTFDAKAIRVKLDALPAHAGSNEITTGKVQGASSSEKDSAAASTD